jgi:hypothetical protein
MCPLFDSPTHERRRTRVRISDQRRVPPDTRWWAVCRGHCLIRPWRRNQTHDATIPVWARPGLSVSAKDRTEVNQVDSESMGGKQWFNRVGAPIYIRFIPCGITHAVKGNLGNTIYTVHSTNLHTTPPGRQVEPPPSHPQHMGLHTTWGATGACIVQLGGR